MKISRISSILVLIFILAISETITKPQTVSAALASTTVWEFRDTATANMVNGGGFNASQAGAGTDYSLQNDAQLIATDLASVGSSTTLTSVAAGFTSLMVGNIIRIRTTGTGAHCVLGWYEIVAFTDATTVTLDRTPNDGTAGVACTGSVGGALTFGALEDTFFEAIVGGNTVWFKNGTYTASATSLNIAATSCDGTNHCNIEGYNSTRGDVPTGSSRPTLAFGATQAAFGQNQNLRYIRFTTSHASGIALGNGASFRNCYALNTSTSTARVALGLAGSQTTAFDSEAISLNGDAISVAGAGAMAINCYAHGSNRGVVLNSSSASVVGSLSEGNASTAVTVLTTGGRAIGNTLYGQETPRGIGVNFVTQSNSRIYNNIIYGFVTGVNASSALKSNFGDYNAFFNNTTARTNVEAGPHDLSVDPQFAGATQIVGSTATSSGSVLTQSGGDFSTVADGIDTLRVVSGTGVTTGGYLISSHTGTTLTVNSALGTSSAGDIVYVVYTGHNFAIGTNLQAAGYPGLFNGSETTSYLDSGAIQRQEPTAIPTCVP